MTLNAQPAVLVRQRLLRALEAPTRLTVLRAPTGFGKTTLLRQWWQARPGGAPVIWATTPARTTTADRYWRSLVDAISQAGVLPSATADGEREAAPARIWSPVWLVLDSYERAPAEADDLLQEWLAESPGLNVVVSTRNRRRFERPERHGLDVKVLGPADLAMTSGEAEALFVQVGVPEARSRARLLRGQTGGWPAPLRAIALALREATGSVSAEVVVQRTTQGYLDEAVLPSLTDPLIAPVLFASAVPDALTPEVAAVLSAGGEGRYLLGHLEEEGMLSREMVDGEAVYRWPALARSALLQKFQHDDPTELREVHRRLALAYWDAGRVPSALGHAMETEDWQLASEILLSDWVRMVRDHGEDVAAFYSKAPSDHVAKNPVLALIAQIVTPLRPVPPADDGGALVEAAAAYAETQALTPAALDMGLALLMSMTRRGYVEPASSVASRIMDLLRDGAFPLWEAADRVPWVGLQVGVVHQLNGDFNAGMQALKMAHTAAGAVSRATVGGAAAEQVAMQAAFAGHLIVARTWMDRAEALATDLTPHRISGRIARLLLALDGLDDLGPEEARRSLLAHGVLDHDEWGFAIHALARYGLLRGDKVGTLSQLQHVRARQATDLPPDSFSRLLLDTVEADLLMALGRLGDARETLLVEARPHPLHVVARARLALLLGEFEEAGTLAASTLADPAATQRIRTDALLIEAAAAIHLRMDNRAVQSLETAIAASQWPGGVWRQFALVPEGTLRALAVVAPRAAAILQALEKEGLREVFPTPVHLTQRERLVLGRMAAGLTQRDLSRELYVSANTIKSQLRSIYRKLGVTSRGQALQVAAYRGLVPRTEVRNAEQ